MTSSTDKHYSLDFRNFRHQQQFLLKLHSHPDDLTIRPQACIHVNLDVVRFRTLKDVNRILTSVIYSTSN